MRVVLDTNTYAAFLKNESLAVDVVRHADALFLPVPVLAELRYGFLNGTRSRHNESILTKFLDSVRVKVLSCTDQTAQYYASLKLQLKKQGTPIPINDLWIAALTLQYNLNLFTVDTDFDVIPQLSRISPRPQ